MSAKEVFLAEGGRNITDVALDAATTTISSGIVGSGFIEFTGIYVWFRINFIFFTDDDTIFYASRSHDLKM